MAFLAAAAPAKQAMNAFGLTNQFQPGQADITKLNLQPQLDTATSNYNQANTGLNTLAQALQQQMAGNGPSLANAQLQQATGANVANQAALAAGQRGASTNVGLLQRQAAQQGMGIQQQATSQANQNRLAEQLAAQQQLGGVLGTQGSLANQQQGQAISGMTGQNQIISGNQQAANTLGAGMGQANAAFMQGLVSSGAQAGAKAAMMADGGTVPTPVTPIPQAPQIPTFSQNFIQGVKPMAQGGTVDMHTPFGPIDYRQGGPVKAQAPQQKATVKGNSLKNDKIPAALSEGEIVLPRTVTQSANPAQSAAQFVNQVMAGKHKKGKK